MSQVLAVDYGTVRVGIAVSDPDQEFALPLGALSVPPRARAAAVARLARERDVETIVIGRPVRAGGEDSALWPQIEKFGAALARRGFRVVYEDEAFTTATADPGPVTPRKRQQTRREGRVDALAAQQILDRYLARRRPRGEG